MTFVSKADMANSQSVIPRIASVRTSAKTPAALTLHFANGDTGRVELSGTIAAKRALASLRDAALFRRAKPSEHGFGVVWPNGIEIGADTLYWLYRQQKGLWDVRNHLKVA